PVVSVVASIGVAFLLFLAGLELDLDALAGAPMKLGAVAFALSMATALALTVPAGRAGIILSPLLVAIAVCATSVGIVVPVLRDTGHLTSPAGLFTIAAGSIAEIGTIALLGVFFAGPNVSAGFEALLLAAIAAGAVFLLVALRRVSMWSAGQKILDRLDDTSAQMRVRFAMMVLIGTAVVAAFLGFEMILGTFLAGAIFGAIIKGDRYEHRLRSKLEGAGFGFFVPAFFVTSGLRFDLGGLSAPGEVWRILFFLVALLLAHGLPALIYRRHLTWRETAATGLLQATNLSFIVVAVTVGTELGRLREVNASALIVAGLLSAVLFPALAQALLGRREGVEPVAVHAEAEAM
ncbi:MAG: cation:proton antiporter, partial [Actinobacteria bacterium]